MQYLPKSVISYTLATLVFLAPLFFWTLTPNFFATSKQFLVLLSVTIILVSYFVSVIQTKSITLPKSKLVYPLLAFISAITLNLIVNVEGRPEALAGKGTLLLILPLLSLLILTLKDKLNLGKALLNIFILGTGLLALETLLQLTLSNLLTFLPSFMQTRSFSLTGSIITTLSLILIGSVSGIFMFKQSEAKLKPYYLGYLILSTITLVAGIALLLPGGSVTLDLIPYRESWSITLDALKSFRSLLVGIGLSNYTLLYTAVKPLSLNLTPLWNTLPQTGTSELLMLLATTGFIGFLSLVWLVVSGYFLAKANSLFSPLSLIYLLLVLSLIFLPGTIPIYALFFIILPLLDHHEGVEVKLDKTKNLVIGVIGIVLTLATYFYALKPTIAEYYMKLAQNALASSDGKAVYDNHLQALKWYPSLTIYHLSYADVNLNLASALSQKSDLTEADRQTISSLISQSIREAKTAIQLRSSYSLAWQTLAKIYRNLINVADGADKFAIDYYGRSVALDPANPMLRVEYGGLFYQLGNLTKDNSTKLTYYSRAKGEFQTAIQLRPTYANAYYNLAKVFETEGDLNSSYLSMQKVVANLDPSSSEYASALAELETLKSKLPKTPTNPTEPSTTGELSTPSPLPSPLPGGPVSLPNDLEPQ